jgi:hypothetical protein
MRMNSYKQLKNRQEKELNSFPMAFAFSKEQLAEGMKKLGLQPDETDKICGIGGGGFIRREDVARLKEMFDRHDQERREAIAEDKTGEGFIYDMFDYELGNHEYGYTGCVSDALSALGLSYEEVEANPLLNKAMRKACHDQSEWYALHG